MIEYKELSRRALIRMSEDYDRDNNNDLFAYLQEHGDGYERIRMVEKATDKVDETVDTISSGFDNFVDKAIDATGSIIGTGLGHLACKGLEWLGGLIL